MEAGGTVLEYSTRVLVLVAEFLGRKTGTALYVVKSKTISTIVSTILQSWARFVRVLAPVSHVDYSCSTATRDRETWRSKNQDIERRSMTKVGREGQQGGESEISFVCGPARVLFIQSQCFLRGLPNKE